MTTTLLLLRSPGVCVRSTFLTCLICSVCPFPSLLLFRLGTYIACMLFNVHSKSVTCQNILTLVIHVCLTSSAPYTAVWYRWEYFVSRMNYFVDLDDYSLGAYTSRCTARVESREKDCLHSASYVRIISNVLQQRVEFILLTLPWSSIS